MCSSHGNITQIYKHAHCQVGLIKQPPNGEEFILLYTLTIVSKAPYTAIAKPTPEMPSVGVTTYLVNSALQENHISLG